MIARLQNYGQVVESLNGVVRYLSVLIVKPTSTLMAGFKIWRAMPDLREGQ